MQSTYIAPFSHFAMKNPEERQRYFIEVIYQGGGYHGWQSQPHGATIQKEIESAIARIHRPTPIVGSGRTDRGVHACGQVAHLDLSKAVNPRRFLHQLNAVLPPSIYAAHMKKVQPQAHARFDALRRRYAYHITSIPHPFSRQTSYYYPHPLDPARMNETAQGLRGALESTSFCTRRSLLRDTLCHIYEAHWTQQQEKMTFHISANRFLHHMVRTIVGTLLQIARNGGGREDLLKIIHQKDRRAAGPNVPPHGLFLLEVTYPDTIYT